MTISSADDPVAGPFDGNGSQTAFPFQFKVFSKTDLAVVVLKDDVQTTLVLDSDYSVSLNGDQDNNPGGTITYPISGAPLPTGATLTAELQLEATQTTDIQNLGGFYPQVIEDALDRCVMLIKQASAGLSRSLRFPLSDADIEAELPPAASRANRVLAFDSSGNPIVIVGVDSGSAAALQLDLADSSSASKGDALLATKQAWTGSVARTQHAVNGDFCTINDALPAGFNAANDATTYIQAALNSGVKVVDFLGVALKCDAITVPAGVWAKDINFTKFTAAAGNVVLVNTGCTVTGKIAGTGLVSAVQRCIYPAADAVTDVVLNVEVSNATYGVHAQYVTGTAESTWPKRWTGYVYCHDIVGTVGASEGYGVLLSPANACVLTVNAKTIARHAVYLSAGSRDNDITASVDGCANYAVQLFSTSAQSATQYNTIRVKARNLSENVAGQSGAVAVVQKAHYNTIKVDIEGNNATSYAAFIEGASGGPYPTGNQLVDGSYTGQFTGTDVIRLINADSTQIRRNTILAYATFGVISMRRSGTNGIVHGGFVEGNNINAQGASIRGIYCEVNTVPTYIGPNEVRNNGAGLRVDDQTSGYRTGFSRRIVISGTTGSVSATSILDVTASLADSLQTTGRFMDIRLSGASVDFTKPSMVIGVLAPPSETQYQFRVYNAHSAAQTFTYQGVAEGD